MKEYRRRKKNNESQSEKLARRGKQNIGERKTLKLIPKTLATEEKQNTNMKEDHAKSVHGDFKMQADQNKFNCLVEKKRYLSFLTVKKWTNLFTGMG